MNNEPNSEIDNSRTGENDAAPPDPSNTNSIGQKVEQGVVSIKEGISEQSNEWEDKLERTIPKENSQNSKAEEYLKKPSPGEINLSNAD